MELGALALGYLQVLPGRRLPGRRPCPLGRLGLAPRRLQAFAGLLERRLGLGQRRLVPGVGLEGVAFGGDLLQALFDPGAPALELGELGLGLRLARRGGGDLLGEAGELRLLGLDLGGLGLEPFGGGLTRFLVIALGGQEGAPLPVEALERGAGVAGERLLALDVGGDLGEPGFAVAADLLDAGLLGVEAVAGERQTVEPRRGFGFRLPQIGHRRGGVGLRRRGGGGLAREFCDRFLSFAERRLGGLPCRARRPPFEMQLDRLGPADMIADVAVARRPSGLTPQPLELVLEGDQDVVQAGEVGVGGAQAQLRLVAAGVEAGDAGRLLEQRPALVRFGADQGADLALADQRRRMRPGGGVGEQDLDVAGPDLPAVDPIGRARAALDAARDLELVGVVEGGRRLARAVVEQHGGLGDVARGSIGGAAEDDVVHLGPPHLLGRTFAHDPLDRLDQIRLAAAVGTDDAGKPGLDRELDGLDEGLEAGEP